MSDLLLDTCAVIRTGNGDPMSPETTGSSPTLPKAMSGRCAVRPERTSMNRTSILFAATALFLVTSARAESGLGRRCHLY